MAQTEYDHYAPGTLGSGILAGLQRKQVLYYGTVPYDVVQKRRRKNRAAHAQRVVNMHKTGRK